LPVCLARAILRVKRERAWNSLVIHSLSAARRAFCFPSSFTSKLPYCIDTLVRARHVVPCEGGIDKQVEEVCDVPICFETPASHRRLSVGIHAAPESGHQAAGAGRAAGGPDGHVPAGAGGWFGQH